VKHNVLITGGGGFVGTAVATELVKHGHNVTIVDRLPKRHNVDGTIYIEQDFIEYIINKVYEAQYNTIIHLAAEHLVEQSVVYPSVYYANNVQKMQTMLDVCASIGIENILFSSSGNVYGRQGSKGAALTEDLYYDPENPYASTKVAGELMIKDYAKAYGIRYVNFRYFNAAGADPECRFGYVQRPATHVIPILCNKILNDEIFTIFGNTYATKDGTCVRDYVHVTDLARAHSLALALLDSGEKNHTFNIGAGSGGISVNELVNIAGDIVGQPPTVIYASPRAGDPSCLYADISKAEALLGWKPVYTIHDSVKHAWAWENKMAKIK
jgi:UDP-glucose 4-epimerase